MFKKLFFVLTFILVTQITFSQVHFGIKAGANYSNTIIKHQLFSEVTYPQPEFKTGYHFGLFADLSLKNNIYTKAELIYSEKGSNVPAIPFAESYTLQLDYLNMPIILGYKLIKGLNIEIGVQPGYLISAETVSKGQSSSFIESLYNKFSLGYVAGVEYFIGKLGLGVRYEHSLISLSGIEARNEKGEVLSEINEYNKNFQGYITYRFKK